MGGLIFNLKIMKGMDAFEPSNHSLFLLSQHRLAQRKAKTDMFFHQQCKFDDCM